jgi:osmotically-inducible protein OsmY
MRNDSDIQLDASQELKWDPRLREDDICVAVRGGVVTLGGHAHSYSDRMIAEQVVSHVRGVQAVANDIMVLLPCAAVRPDSAIAHAAGDALAWNTAIPGNCLHVVVENGWIKLSGHVDWYFQKEEAEHLLRGLRGVRGVTNFVMVKPRPMASDVKEQITEALLRGVAFDAAHIAVDIVDHQVTLSGTVRSFAEKRDAERAARNAPGVTDVDNRLTVEPHAMAVVL